MLVDFPDVEQVFTDKVRDGLPAHGYELWDAEEPTTEAVFVSNTRGRHKRAVWIRRDGGPQLDRVRDAPRLGVNVYDPDDEDAIDLARIVSAIIRGAADGTPVLRVKQLSGPTSVADPTGPRRYMTFDVHVRGAALT